MEGEPDEHTDVDFNAGKPPPEDGEAAEADAAVSDNADGTANDTLGDGDQDDTGDGDNQQPENEFGEDNMAEDAVAENVDDQTADDQGDASASATDAGAVDDTAAGSPAASGEQQTSKARKSPPPDQISTVYVTGLPMDMLDRELINLCRFLPNYEGCSVKSGNAGRASNGVSGFVKFRDRESAENAMKQLNGVEFEADSRKFLKAEIARREMKLNIRDKPRLTRRRPEMGRDREPMDRPPRDDRGPPLRDDRQPPRERSPPRDYGRRDPPARDPYGASAGGHDHYRNESDRRYSDQGASRHAAEDSRYGARYESQAGYSESSDRRPAPHDAYSSSRSAPQSYDSRGWDGRADDRYSGPPTSETRYDSRAPAGGSYGRGYEESRYDDQSRQPDSRYETGGRYPEPHYDTRDGPSAKRARYDSTPQRENSGRGEARDTLCVRGLDDKSDQTEVEQMFCTLPGYVMAKLQNTKSAIVAFVKFSTEDDAQSALKQMQGFVVQSSPRVELNIEIARRSLRPDSARKPRA